MYKLFWLKPNVPSSDWLIYAEGMSYTTKLCEQNPDHAVIQKRCKPLKLVVQMHSLTDFQWTPYGEAIVSTRIVERFRASQISGVSFDEIEAYTSTGVQVAQELYELRVEGWGGMALRESGVRLLKECPFCKRRVFTGYNNAAKLFNFDEWDGSDVFMTWPLPRNIIVTGRVHDLLSHEEISGVQLVPLDSLPKLRSGTLTPGNVRDWFSDDRVEIMERNIDDGIEGERE